MRVREIARDGVTGRNHQAGPALVGAVESVNTERVAGPPERGNRCPRIGADGVAETSDRKRRWGDEEVDAVPGERNREQVGAASRVGEGACIAGHDEIGAGVEKVPRVGGELRSEAQHRETRVARNAENGVVLPEQVVGAAVARCARAVGRARRCRKLPGDQCCRVHGAVEADRHRVARRGGRRAGARVRRVQRRAHRSRGSRGRARATAAKCGQCQDRCRTKGMSHEGTSNLTIALAAPPAGW